MSRLDALQKLLSALAAGDQQHALEVTDLKAQLMYMTADRNNLKTWSEIHAADELPEIVDDLKQQVLNITQEKGALRRQLTEVNSKLTLREAAHAAITEQDKHTIKRLRSKLSSCELSFDLMNEANQEIDHEISRMKVAMVRQTSVWGEV